MSFLPVSAEWTAPPILNPTLDTKPQLAIEICRNPRTRYLPLRALIVGPTVFLRRLDLPKQLIKSWLAANWQQIQALVRRFQQSFQPHKEYPHICLAMVEFVSDFWIIVRDKDVSDTFTFFPIVLGYTPPTETQGGWNSLQLPRPTVEPRLGTGAWKVRNCRLFER